MTEIYKDKEGTVFDDSIEVVQIDLHAASPWIRDWQQTRDAMAQSQLTNVVKFERPPTEGVLTANQVLLYGQNLKSYRGKEATQGATL